MNRDFKDMLQLLEAVKEDRMAIGAGASMLNRYPVRFVLFDNFKDSKEFVLELMGLGVTKMQKIVDWMDKDYPDQMMTYSHLSSLISNYIAKNCDLSCIIVPFSELARFYDNKDAKEFDALVSDIKGVQTTSEGFDHKQRIYIPMIGQYGKMAKFFTDSQSVIWHLASMEQNPGYNMILSHGTYCVKGLEHSFTVVNNVTDWLKVWRDEEAKPNIISVSRSMFALSGNAQPDNALTYIICHNAFEFLTKGLSLNFGNIVYRKEDEPYWIRLASEIEYKDFSFKSFFNKYFDIYDLSDSSVFVKTWFENTDKFNRWLLTVYYTSRFSDNGYICHILKDCGTYSNIDFIRHATLCIFNLENKNRYINERNLVLNYAKQYRIQIPDTDDNKLCKNLKNLAIECGYSTALKYISGLTIGEKELLISWIANNHISVKQILNVYPDLYYYLENSTGISDVQRHWVMEYINAYKTAKIANKYTDVVKALIDEHNQNAVTFSSWYNQFKTVRTELCGRNDIEVFYWIDGLGIDWIPFILWVLKQYENEGIYVNDVIIARSLLPTKTENNKGDLEKLANDSLSKKGDLDNFAHKCTPYPRYIIKELEIVETAIKEIVAEHAGKKIAIVSDHGISYLSQLCKGYNLGGIESDHCGRCARCINGSTTSNDKYIRLSDGITLCSLRHRSLTSKIADGQGCHGGCTPEEVLVPIIIISSNRQAAEYTVNLIDNEVCGNNPILTFRIKGLSNFELPKLIYNKIGYNLHCIDNDRYQSDRLDLISNIDSVELRIGSYSKEFKIKINLGAEEEDPFS